MDIDNAKAQEAYFATPVVPQKKLDSVSSLLSIFADHLSMKSNQIAVQTANAEPPVIAKAKQFIREHHTEDLSLGQVAAGGPHQHLLLLQAVQESHRHDLHRVRLAHARREGENLLLNPNLRISEIAYEVGFPIPHALQPRVQENRGRIADGISRPLAEGGLNRGGLTGVAARSGRRPNERYVGMTKAELIKERNVWRDAPIRTFSEMARILYAEDDETLRRLSTLMLIRSVTSSPPSWTVSKPGRRFMSVATTCSSPTTRCRD